MPNCDACGEVFQPELPDKGVNDEMFDLEEQLEEEGWISDDEGAFCPEHTNYHPDHVQIDYGRNILE